MNASGTQKDMVDCYGRDVCWWRRWAETVHWCQRWFISTHDIHECRSGRKAPLQTLELNNQIKARQKQPAVLMSWRFQKLKLSQLFGIFASMRMSVVVVLLEVVGQKAERKLAVTQEMLLFWLWRATSTAKQRKYFHANRQDQTRTKQSEEKMFPFSGSFAQTVM